MKTEKTNKTNKTPGKTAAEIVCENCFCPAARWRVSIGADNRPRFFCSNECLQSARGRTPGAPLPIAPAKPGIIKRLPKTPGEIARQRRPTETQLSNGFAAELDALRVFNLRLNSGAVQLINKNWLKLCPTGTPDRFLLAGVACFIEVKKENEPATDIQTKTHSILRQSGALCFVVDRASQFEIIKRELTRASGENWVRIRLIVNLVNEIQTDIDRRLKLTE